LSDKRKKNKDGKGGKSHLWIPDTEVSYVDYDPTSRPVKLDIDHVHHGKTLSEGLKGVFEKHKSESSPVSEELMVFKVELREGEKVDKRGDYEKIFLNNKLKVNAIKKSNIAIVSANPSDINLLDGKLNKYIQEDGKSSDFFQYIKSLSIHDAEEKKSKELLGDITEDEKDLQITLIPHLEKDQYEKIITHISEKIKEANGKIIGEPFVLSNNTPIIRVLMPSSGIDSLTDQEIVYQVGLTPFFDNNIRGGGRHQLDISDCKVEFNGDPRDLPIVCILDDGIKFPNNLKDCIAGRWTPKDITGGTTCTHGTKVASCAIFGESLKEQIRQKNLTPQLRVIDAVISDGKSKLPEPVLIERIKSAVREIKSVTKIFCLSFNQFKAFDEENISNIAYELDVLTREHDVQFVLSAGNHKLWLLYDKLEEILDDDDGRVASPAESFYGLTVGSITTDNHERSISHINQISPFSRYGLGYAGSAKPDVVYPGGNVYRYNTKNFISAESVYVINSNGGISLEFGTSFSAPLAARDIAFLTRELPNNDPLIAKGLLIHHSDTLDELYDSRTPEERAILAKMHGKGRGSYINSIESYKQRATFIRKGTMSRMKKQRVKFYMPTSLSNHAKNKVPVAKISVTCISLPPVDNTRGYEYLRGYVGTSLKCINSNNTMVNKNPKGEEGRSKWQHIHHFSQILTTFNPGDYQLWLQLYTKPEIMNDEEIDFVLIVTIEDMTGNDVDVYGGIEQEAGTRFYSLAEVEVEVENADD
jgi:Subtilase family